MRKAISLGLTTLAALILMGGLAGTATGAHFSISSREIRAVWRELIFRAKETQLQIGEIICEATLEGRFRERTIAKSGGTQIGEITRAIIAHPCRANRAEMFFNNGTEEVLGIRPANSLPWPIAYVGFVGTLPRIERVLIQIKNIVMTVSYTSLSTCLAVYGSPTEEEEGRMQFTLGNRGEITRFEAERFLIRTARSLVCPLIARLLESATEITPQGETARLTITLI